jgi:predicted CXXCH cytochrome family protein
MNASTSASNRWVWLAGVATFLFAAVTVSQHAYAGIADTRHNLGSSNTVAGSNQVTDTAEICVFCHTPHQASDQAGAPPLWNKRLGTAGAPAGGGSYTTYNTATSSTIDGEVLAVGSVSVACLSCHDGTQAMDNIINAPGSGGYDATGGGTNGLGYTWNVGGTVDTNGILTSGVALIGTDLSNDHPIGIAYCGGGITGTATSGCKDEDFKGGGTNPAISTQNINGTQVWWVDTGAGGAGTRQKTDMILYTRTTFAAGAGPSVECASCHDPHTSVNPTFLRTSNAGSAVCLACHVK